MTYESSSAASDISLAPFGLRIIRAMQPSAARGETAECVALRSRGRDRLDERNVANSIVSSATPWRAKQSSASVLTGSY
jgi:hypothetical protein